MLQFASALTRSTDGAVQCAVGLKDAITLRNKLFKPFITTVVLCKATPAKATYISDTEGYCQVWCSEQTLQPEDVQLIRGSCDFGGTGIKVSFSFLVADDLRHSAVSQSGVRRVCVFLLASGVKESYEVMKSLLQLSTPKA